MTMTMSELDYVRSTVREVPDFPKPGILFLDIMKKMLMQLVSLAIQRILNFQQHRMLTMFQRQNRMQFS